jgi:hypothetical protein
MSLRTIQMDPTLLKVSKKKKTKKTIVPPSVMINQPNLRQILLDKLLKHRNTQKKKEPSILNNNFDQQCALPSSPAPTVVPTVVPVSCPEPVTTIAKDKPYGVLKNGLKPTYKTWNSSQKNLQSIDEPVIVVTPSVQPSVQSPMQPSVQVFESVDSSPTCVAEPLIAEPLVMKPLVMKPLVEPVKEYKSSSYLDYKKQMYVEKDEKKQNS